ncbi:hypothetical protein ACHAWO_001839 [Cyclotella atomus]|uniref:alkylglycerone-phosphate synthase n=1 Tax=Cyclotella atomus TaxID=382360 RepID=A0ABD3QZF0_9STRA
MSDTNTNTTTTKQKIIQTTFHTISNLIRTSPPVDDEGNKIHVSDSTRLKLYGYYKVATSTSTALSETTRPSIFDPVGRAKYDAWLQCSQECDGLEAMRGYVEFAAGQNESVVGRECEKLYREMLRQLAEVTCDGKEGQDDKRVLDAESSQEMNRNAAKGAAAEVQKETTSKSTSFAQYILSYLPTPLLPRGQLDISFLDLFYAIYQCLHHAIYHMFFNGPIYNVTARIMSSIVITLINVFFGRFHPNQRGKWFETEIIASVKKMENDTQTDLNSEVVVGLSVRSLLDLYLSVRSFPAGSDVIVVPGISIQGMVDVLEYNDLTLIPVDIPESSDDATEFGVCNAKWGIDSKAVKAAVSDKTVAILVVHPFGAMIADDSMMKQLRDVADAHSIEIWEDCAQCFTGKSTGSRHANVSFVSFGPIKTCTALGGGLAVLRNGGQIKQSHVVMEMAESMKRMQESIYPQQSTFAFFKRVAKCIVFHLLSYSLLSCGAIKSVIEFIGLDYNKFVVSALRGFSARNTKELMKQLRRRPCPALLALLYRRLKYSHVTNRTSMARKKRCDAFEKRLSEMQGEMVIPRHMDGSAMNGWIYPILVKDPVHVSKALLNVGIDAPCGLTQLKPIKSNCPRICAVFDHILYLPVTNNNFNADDEIRLIRAVKELDVSKEQTVLQKRRPIAEKEHVATALIAILFQWYFIDLHHPSFRMMLSFAYGSVLTSLCVLTSLILLSRYMGPIYLQSSNTFAKYCDMLFKSPFDHEHVNEAKDTKYAAFQQSATVLNLESTKIPHVQFDGEASRMCLLTGATGFIGSLLLRELLLHRNALRLDGVAVIVRSKRGKSAIDRVKGLLSQAMFDFLSEEEKSSIVHVVEGDVTLPNCGLAQQQLVSIRDWNISHVFHCAAAVSFQQPLEQAAVSNITSSLQMQQFTKNLRNKTAKFVYISTAFVHGGKTGTRSRPLPETLFSLDPYNPFELYKSMLGSQSYASSAMNELGFPNTYTFSKCICEHLLQADRSVNTMIIRPSIVGPSAKEPFEGWAGEKPSTIVAAACLYLKFPYNMWCFGKEFVPFVPADVVCRFVISKAFTTSKRSSDEYSAAFAEEKKEVSLDEQNIEMYQHMVISTVAWDVSSSAQSSFSWVGYAFAITHLGSVCGHVNRVVAYAGLLLSTKIFPWFNFKYTTFHRLHSIFVRGSFDMILNICEWINAQSSITRYLKALSPLLDLPMLFFLFANQNFYFQSDLSAPSDFNGERYMFSCVVAAHKFILAFEERRPNQLISKTNLRACSVSKTTAIVAAGSNHNNYFSDLLWALTQPTGNIFIRTGGWALTKIFRLTTTQIEVDASSFVELARTLSKSHTEPQPHVIIAPTHRSFYDFLIISYICFSYPEFGIEVPFIAAADDFRNIPIVGWLARGAQAFFIKRGGKGIDPDLRRELDRIPSSTKTPTFIEVFIEGKRSRYRTFSTPKTGFLRCLAETSHTYLVLPVTINYEALPDEMSLMEQANYGCGKPISPMSLNSLMHWLYRAYTRDISIGRVNVSASGVLDMPDSSAIGSFCYEIQRCQQSRILVSDYHVKAASESLSIPYEVIAGALADLHVTVWPLFGEELSKLGVPRFRDLQWAAMLHFVRVFAPFLSTSHPTWASWLSPSRSELQYADGTSDNIDIVVKNLAEHFDAADSAVEDVVSRLQLNGFANPDENHIAQYLTDTSKLPLFLTRVAVRMRWSFASDESLRQAINAERTGPLFDQSSLISNPDVESWGKWGYQDSYFVLHVGSNGSKDVVMKGNRYSISGKKLTKLAPFVEEQMQVKINPNDQTFPDAKYNHTPATALGDDIYEIVSLFDEIQVSIEPQVLARHAAGHTQEDMYSLRSGFLQFRLPDLVVWPTSIDDLKKVVSLATARDMCLIPFGGGTNVTHATHCPDKSIDPRPMISVDMKSMNQVIWVNKEDGLAHVEAGITGRELIEHMEKLGLTIGHEPDSYEFSTLGGWIATKASGMKQNRYGNIEDIVKEVTVLGANGIVSNVHAADKVSHGRVSAGVDFKSIMLGSEGGLGIIVSAVIKVWPIAEKVSYESVLLPDFDAGLSFVKTISKMRTLKPASVRLLDNDQFRLGQALKPESSRFEYVKSVIAKQIGFMYGRLSDKSVVCATITFEGSHLEVEMQKKIVRDAASSHCGILAGPSVGKAGYDLTFAIAYLRDFALNYNMLGESFETFVPWSKLKHLVDKTKQRIRTEHRKRSLPGVPFICSRVTQLYDEGACVYFYFCMNIRGVSDPSKTFSSIEVCARQEIIAAGGSLSHHHGIGKLRAPFVRQIYSNEYVNSMVAIKNALDPNNVFGARNGVLANI